LPDQEWVTIINRAVEGVIAANRYAYEEIYDGLAESQRKLAHALSTEPTRNIYSTEYIRRFNLRSAPNVAKALHALQEKELVEKTEQRYRISDIFFAQWLTKTE